MLKNNKKIAFLGLHLTTFKRRYKFRSIFTIKYKYIFQVSSTGGRLLHCFDTGQPLNCVTYTPEQFQKTSQYGYQSKYNTETNKQDFNSFRSIATICR